MLRWLALVLALAWLAPCPAMAQSAADLTSSSISKTDSYQPDPNVFAVVVASENRG